MRKSLLVTISILVLAFILQTSVIGRINLLHGEADLVLLVLAALGLQERVRGIWIWTTAAGLLAGLISGVPWYIYLIGYLIVSGMARLLARRVWQASLLVMFAVTLIGSLILLLLTYVYRSFFEVALPFGISFSEIILPSLMLNLLLAVPVHALAVDLAKRVFPRTH